LMILTLFFFLLLRLPPLSPLFPYTTLFRSGLMEVVLQDEIVELEHCLQLLGETHRLEQVLQPDRAPRHFVFIRRADAPPGGAYLDRKSTRLNSSHDQISYAVFCLKKKKTLH